MIVRHDIIMVELHEIYMHPIRMSGFKIQRLQYDNIDFMILQLCNIRFHASTPDPGWTLSVLDHSPRSSGGDRRLSWVLVIRLLRESQIELISRCFSSMVCLTCKHDRQSVKPLVHHASYMHHRIQIKVCTWISALNTMTSDSPHQEHWDITSYPI